MRELSHVIERAVLTSTNDTIERLDFSLTQVTVAPAIDRAQTPVTLDQAEQEMIRDALDRCGGNILKTAELLGLSRAALYRRLEKFSIRVPE